MAAADDAQRQRLQRELEKFDEALRRRRAGEQGLAAEAAPAGYQESWLQGPPLPLPSFEGARLERRDHRSYTVLFDHRKHVCRLAAIAIPAHREHPKWLGRHEKPDGPAFLAHLDATEPFDDEPGVAGQINQAWYDRANALGNGDPRSFDRGHMIAREQVAFGSDFQDAAANAAESYYFTNMAPQTPAFNEGRIIADRWRPAEIWLTDLSEAQARVVHFTGPVFCENDPLIEPTDMRPHQIRVPCRYWKVFAAQSVDYPEVSIAHAFILDDTTNVTQQVDAINRAWRKEQHPGIAPELPTAPQRPGKTVIYWCPIANIRSVAGFDASAFEAYAGSDERGTEAVQSDDFATATPKALSLTRS
jgi:hypothetical protein